jgi:tetratricopeptide (TPR) repeat protein
MGMDVELLRLVHQRRLLGKPTVLEVNDWLPGVQRCNPVHANWNDSRAWQLLSQLIDQCDAVQVSSQGLAERLAPMARRIHVIANQMPQLPPFRPRIDAGPLRIGWGGSAGHFDDIAAIAPALVTWLGQQSDAQLEVMADPQFQTLFEQAPAGRFRFLAAGSLDHYFEWLEGLDIGLAPLLPSDYNHCRSDVKFLEYASRSVVPVLQRCPTYANVRDGETGLLFSDIDELLNNLDALVADPKSRQRLAEAAHSHVLAERRLEQHVPKQLAFYRQLLYQSSGPQLDAITASWGPALGKAGAADLAELRALPGWQQLSARHWSRNLAGPAEQQLEDGLEAIKQNAWPRALEHFRQAAAADPTDPYPLVFLGQALERLQRPALAQKAYERAAKLDPLCSRPLRALGALHPQALPLDVSLGARHFGRPAHRLGRPLY